MQLKKDEAREDETASDADCSFGFMVVCVGVRPPTRRDTGGCWRRMNDNPRTHSQTQEQETSQMNWYLGFNTELAAVLLLRHLHVTGSATCLQLGLLVSDCCRVLLVESF